MNPILQYSQDEYTAIIQHASQTHVRYGSCSPMLPLAQSLIWLQCLPLSFTRTEKLGYGVGRVGCSVSIQPSYMTRQLTLSERYAAVSRHIAMLAWLCSRLMNVAK